jgi:hypothetical protein
MQWLELMDTTRKTLGIREHISKDERQPICNMVAEAHLVAEPVLQVVDVLPQRRGGHHEQHLPGARLGQVRAHRLQREEDALHHGRRAGGRQAGARAARGRPFHNLKKIIIIPHFKWRKNKYSQKKT